MLSSRGTRVSRENSGSGIPNPVGPVSCPASAGCGAVSAGLCPRK